MREHVARTTDGAMRGEVSLSDIYGQRLQIVRPTRDEMGELTRAYLERIEPGAREAVALFRDAHLRVVLVTGGLREAILPLAASLGLAPTDVSATSIYFAEDGSYAGFETESPLAQNRGKVRVVRGLGLERPIIAIGDGITDLELKTATPPAVDEFVAYAGIIDRPAVTSVADHVIRSFAELPGIIFA